MRIRLPRYGAYHGRLAFDGEFHTDPDGRRVVTTDGGLTWRYGRYSDTSHNVRYSKRTLVVQGTDRELVDLALEHGTPENPNFEKAHAILRELHPQHYGPVRTDPHRHALVTTPDAEAATETSHTDAYKETQ